MKGFSFIELMIVMAIIGILTSIAVPSYQEYILRAKVSNLMMMAQPTKLAVTENLITGSNTAIEKISNRDIIKEISVNNNVITITGDSEKLGIHPKTKTLKITLTPELDNLTFISWKCTVDPSEFKKYVPAECRG